MRILLLFCCFIAAVQQIPAIKLNYPRVLLPIFNKLSINFTLEVIEGGCFKWSSSRPDLVLITPVYDNPENVECASTAVLTTLSREKRRSSALVLAQDLGTGEILRCDVILDVINQLGVLTTTRELYLEEAPETFELWAEDTQGNTFTTLEGIEFNWKISSQTPVEGKERDWHQVLRFLRFSESKYHEVPSSVEKFDRLGLRGYMILLEGINTGSAKVTVTLPYAEYNVVSPIEVNIVVLANIILDPSDVHILVGDSISFRILQLKQGKLEDITSNTQYYLEIENPELASLSGNRATGRVLGRTAVILKDRNVANNLEKSELVPSIQATLTVSRADKLAINLLPHYNWVTVEGEEHTIALDLYTNDNQLITLGSAYTISSSFDESIFRQISSTANGSQIYGETIKTGKSQVLGSYEKLKANSELQVYSKLVLTPAKVYLPYDPNHIRKQRIQYKATGGDNLYVWSNFNSNLIGISQSGLAETKTGNVAGATYGRDDKNLSDYAQVKVALQRNVKISRTADVFFLPPKKLEIVRYNFETTLKDYIFLHIALYAEHEGQLVPFTSCENLHFEYDFSEDIFRIDTNAKLPDNQQLHESACHLVALQAYGLGNSHFKISHTVFDRTLRAEAQLMVFEKMNILNPETNEIVLPIGATRNVIYQNGPQKVFSIDAELTKRVHIDERIATAQEIANQYTADKHIFNVLCQKVGSTQLSFEIFNTLPVSNHVPYVSKFETVVHCVKPRFINLYTAEKLKQSCPLKIKNSLMHVKRDENQLEIGIEVLDSENRKLHNISSLTISWKFAQSDANQYDYEIAHQRQKEEDILAGVAIPKRDYLLTSIPEIQNTFKIKASVDGYNNNILYGYSITPESPEFGIAKGGKGELYKPNIENELSFLAVNSTLLPYDSISIFLSPNHKKRVQIIQGSGFYDIKPSERDVVNVQFDSETRQLLIEPLQIGAVEIEVIDLCLMTDPSRLFVSVVSIGRIEVQVADLVERGKTIEAIVKLYDSLDSPLNLDYNNIQIYDLHEHIWNSAILSYELGSFDNLNVGEVRYFVTGLELGETKTTITSGSGDKVVSSQAFSIQVFAPLRLLPRNSTIVIGSTIQIEAQGGPHPDLNIVFSVENENILSVDLSIAKGLRLGRSKIVGRCIGINPVNSQQIVYSEDTIEINVVPLNKVKIHTPLRKVQSGAILPASIWAIPNISPMILGTLNSKVKWHTNQPDVIEINGIFSDAGIEYDEYDSIAVRLKALNPGTARIQADFTSQHGLLSCSIEITVFKLLELELPKRISTDSIIVPPKAQIQLKTNLPNAKFYTVENNSGLRVSLDGILRTSENVGRDLIIAKSDDQSLSIPIETKNIHFVLATLHAPTIKLRQLETKIPNGMSVILKVSLHDNLGNEFSHGLQDTSIVLPKLAVQEGIDVNLGNNFTVALSLPRETSNMLSISLKDALNVKYNEDFVKLSVSKTTTKFPTKKIFSVADIICFESPLAQISEWTTSDASIVAIEQNSGVGLVKASRSKYGEQVFIVNGNEQHGFIKYDVEIREADSIEFRQKNDIFNGKNYKGHVIIKNHLQLDKQSNLIAKNATSCLASIDQLNEKFFKCDLKVNAALSNAIKVLESLSVNAVFDKQYGSYACEIDLKSKDRISDLISLVKNDEFHFELVATLLNGISGVSHLKLIPAISVFPLEIALEQLEQQTITVNGLDKILQRVHLSSSDPSSFEIQPMTKAHGVNQYKVKPLKSFPIDETAFIAVNSPLTQQTIQIPIQSLKMSPKCASQPFQGVSTFALNLISNLGLIVSALIILSATIWVFIYCFSSSSNQVEDTSSFQKTPKRQQVPITNLPSAPPRQPVYPGSPFLDKSNSSNGSPNSSFLQNSGGNLPVYGDSTLISPNKRINRRYL